MFHCTDFVLSTGKYHGPPTLILNLNFLCFLKACPQMMYITVFLLTWLYPCRSPAPDPWEIFICSCTQLDPEPYKSPSSLNPMFFWISSSTGGNRRGVQNHISSGHGTMKWETGVDSQELARIVSFLNSGHGAICVYRAHDGTGRAGEGIGHLDYGEQELWNVPDVGAEKISGSVFCQQIWLWV